MTLAFEQDKNGVEKVQGITYEFPYTMHERHLTDTVIPWHWHEELELDYAYRGSIKIETAKRTYHINQGEAYFINTNVMTKKGRLTEAGEAIEHAHLFHPILLAGYYRSIFETKYLDPILKNHDIDVIVIKPVNDLNNAFIALLKRLTSMNEQPDMEMEIRDLLSQAWLLLMQIVQSQNQQTSVNDYPYKRVKQVLNFIYSHYPEKITLSKLADCIQLSPRETTRIFKTVCHQTPMDCLMTYRLEQAKRLLRESSDAITDIAFQTGFNNSAYFSKTFKEHMHQTPKEYRKLNSTPFSAPK
ncbi:AraC family transcriptional regulator [Levilactobacillus bambusae]|uniref:HTH araC/xylS-type domain-containing protein n=1 Tax=Levilactobacillus bambusae TaxID=2024736 RepID=A0A2V1N4C9_9LACO|nr:helix-turn-helix domain-containing protein [Levilactobacillus bambusae]PWG00816.1 hypothetical protein DCM90_01160 [Levilactobacillus bambusae]